ncbi:GTPase domain-containing protein [Tychonema sp. LEGE 06208]|uniref:GTPase domain-containing protein n=1 Tax=Tychonema sp. LEGE 06208 TaxID=1828663 RepID=UPI0018805F99|nr:GTPase domain-containing protein [Tychonema sp. LEGE 06208]MBE9163076.1 GTPase domain-containing protein [Tychonema sp. LEGE 06208]
MTDFTSLSDIKDSLIRALETLPEETILLADEAGSTFAKANLVENVQQDIERLESFWEFLHDYRNTKVIALVGMVNAGKSALGNHLLNRGESGVFQEASIRETSQAQEAKIDEETVIIDLPGLGSVLCEEDDTIVKGIIRRANLLLLVFDVSYPIPRHFYEFLKSNEVLKSKALQRIVIVINKIDCLSDLPEKVKQKQIQSYINFLSHGNEKMEFEGIARLFDYEIPIVSFSVAEARRYSNSDRERQLRQVIYESLEVNSNSAINRAEVELVEVASKYSIVIASYIALRKREEKLGEQMTYKIQTVIGQINESINREVDTLSNRIGKIRGSCLQEMRNYQTTGDERFWQGDNFRWKKNKSMQCRDRYQDEIVSEFQIFVSNLRSNILIVARNLVGSFQISEPSSDSIISNLKNSIYEIWDAFDDYWFLDKDRDTFDRSIEQSDQYFNRAANEIDNWLTQFQKDISETLFTNLTKINIFEEYYFYKNHADSLQYFCDVLTSID